MNPCFPGPPGTQPSVQALMSLCRKVDRCETIAGFDNLLVVVVLPDPFLGWGRGSIPRNPNNRATPHGRDQRSRRERVWLKMARRRGSSTGQSSTRCERSCGSEPQLLHEGVSARPTLWR